MSEIVIEVRGLSKVYQDGPEPVSVLEGIDFSLGLGESVAIVGASGSGKSTFLHLLGGLDKPSAGEISVKGHIIHALSEKARCQLRNRCLGFVYQFHHLLPEFTALENVAMPLLLGGHSVEMARLDAIQCLEAVGLAHRINHKPSELSGGERQRTAIARALVTQPAVILADEPTGNLDRRTAGQVMALIHSLREQFSTSIMIVTHDPQIAREMDRQYTLVEGRLA